MIGIGHVGGIELILAQIKDHTGHRFDAIGRKAGEGALGGLLHIGEGRGEGQGVQEIGFQVGGLSLRIPYHLQQYVFAVNRTLRHFVDAMHVSFHLGRVASIAQHAGQATHSHAEHIFRGFDVAGLDVAR